MKLIYEPPIGDKIREALSSAWDNGKRVEAIALSRSEIRELFGYYAAMYVGLSGTNALRFMGVKIVYAPEAGVPVRATA